MCCYGGPAGIGRDNNQNDMILRRRRRTYKVVKRYRCWCFSPENVATIIVVGQVLYAFLIVSRAARGAAENRFGKRARGTCTPDGQSKKERRSHPARIGRHGWRGDDTSRWLSCPNDHGFAAKRTHKGLDIPRGRARSVQVVIDNVIAQSIDCVVLVGDATT